MGGLRQWRLWGRLGWREVQRRYSRTVIGPFWSAISLGMFVLALGAVGTGLFSRGTYTYIPFLAAGMVVWVTVATIVNESCSLFISGASLFRQMRFNYSVLAYALVWRNFIVFAHNFLVFVVLYAVFSREMPSLNLLLAIPGMAILLINAAWVSFLLGLLCLRFRDIQQLVGTIVQISMFVTPIFWPPDRLSGLLRLIFVDLNPLFHLLDIVRSPLLSQVPALETYIACGIITVTGWSMTYAMFSYFRKRVAYWS